MKALHQICHRHRIELEVADYDNTPEGSEETERDMELIRPVEERETLRLHHASAHQLPCAYGHAEETNQRNQRSNRRIVDRTPVQPRETARRMRGYLRRVTSGDKERLPPTDQCYDVIHKRKGRENRSCK